MNIEKIYFDIEMDSDCFCIFESTSKSKTDNSALVLLEKIKNIVEKNLKYNDQCNDKYSNLPKPILLQCLKEIATKVFTGYKEKVAQLNFIERLFFYSENRLDPAYKDIEAPYSRINYCIGVAPLALTLPFPKELMPEILRHLDISDLGIFAQINRLCKIHAMDALVKRAEDYGYQGDSPFNPTEYLKKLFHEILWSKNILSTKYCPPPSFLGRIQHPIKTLANLKNIDAENFFTIVLCNGILEPQYCYIGKATVRQQRFFLTNFYRFLSKLLKELPKKDVLREIDRCDKYGNTALIRAAWRNDKEMVKLLLEFGANSRIVNASGSSAIDISREKNHRENVDLLTAHAADESVPPNS